ncbi:Protein kinase domain-containing protein ppk32 [Dimargaris verticillata]|uniref:Protein kinase domain-containing protein ppk32 n=1 Tax=Dimargaris verticillata TaxID=2761393 RepID=A0A9W8E9C1_9FUNG|nr:Protein kinase domain-containing protein ppk32 [Dimargaris verticillata]
MQSYISSLSRLVPTGSAIWREYESDKPISASGLWTIHAGKKRTTSKPVAIFVFEKKYFETGVRRQLISRHEQDKILEVLKKEVGQLTRLRHPSILQVVEPLEESRSSLMFVTEPILGCLEDMIEKDLQQGQVQRHWNAGDGVDVDEFDLDELEIQKGLLQVSKALQFCHNDAKLVHGNLTPSSIFVNVKGDWKLGGLGFSTFLDYQNGTLFPTSINFEFDYQLPPHCQPNLDFLAPEFVLDNLCNVSNDIFALGCFAVAVHGEGRQPHDGTDSLRMLGVSALHCRSDVAAYQRQIRALSNADLSFLPAFLQPVVRHLLARDPSQRLPLADFQNSQYFDNVLMSTIKYLETLVEKSKENKIAFMEGLPRILPQYPERVLKRKILSGLLEELKDHSMLPYTLPNVFYIAEKLERRDFMEKVFPGLKEVLTVRDPPQNLMVLLDKIDLLKNKTPEDIFKNDVMPVVYCALESGNPLLIDKALQVIPQLSEVLDYTLVKSTLFPKVQSVYAKATILSVKVNCLKCFHSMLKILDKFTMTEKLIPMLKRTKTREPGVILAIMIVYEEMGQKYLEKEAIATEIIPELWRLCMEPQLNPGQFQRFMVVIKDVSQKVEEQQSKHLQDLSRLNSHPAASSVSSAPNGSNNPSGQATPNIDGFEQLVRASGNTTGSNTGSGLDADHPFKSFAPANAGLVATPTMATASPSLTSSTTTTTASTWGLQPALAPSASTITLVVASGNNLSSANMTSAPAWDEDWGTNWGTAKPSSLNQQSTTNSLRNKCQQHKQKSPAMASSPGTLVFGQTTAAGPTSSLDNLLSNSFTAMSTTTQSTVTATSRFPPPQSTSTLTPGVSSLSSFALPRPPRSSPRGSVSTGNSMALPTGLKTSGPSAALPTSRNSWSMASNTITPTVAPVSNSSTSAALQPALVPMISTTTKPPMSSTGVANDSLKMFDPFSS